MCHRELLRVVSLLRPLFMLLLSLATPGGAWAESGLIQGQAQFGSDSAVAGEDGASLRFESGAVVHLAPAASVSQREANVWFPKLGLVRSHVLQLHHGSVQVHGTDRRPVVVRSGRLTVASFGGELAVGTETALALRGRAWIRKHGSWRWLVEGDGVRVETTGVLTRTSSELEAPAMEAPRVLVAAGEPAALDSLEWSEIAGAESYQVTLRRKDTGREILRTYFGEVPSGKTSKVEPLVRLSPGRYTAEVHAIDDRGLPGGAGTTEVVVVGVVGEGVAADGPGVISAPSRTNLRFEYVEGLEMSLGDTSEWFAAVPSLMLHHDDGVSIRLRHPEASAFAHFEARVRTPPSVAVRVGPKTAVWPRDQINASIDLGALGDWDVVKPLRIVASVGTEPIEVSWSRRGSSMTTTIPVVSGPGPWVVRVVVYDAAGDELGRDHVEVVRLDSGSRRSLGVK